MTSTASALGNSLSYVIGLDFGTESARGVLLDAHSGMQIKHSEHAYSHGVITKKLPSGVTLPSGWALQNADDYLEAAQRILKSLGQGRRILSIGLDFTASSPMPTTSDGTPLSRQCPDDPHAYVKLWKHSAQHQAEQISAQGGPYLANFGGKVSGEWLLAKGAQIAEEAPDTWSRSDRFIEAGDWLVLQLTGVEARSCGFAGFKAQWLPDVGYPDVVEGIQTRLAEPLPIGRPAGELDGAWRELTGILGPAIVAVAVIDSHACLPAVDDMTGDTLVAALGTSAVYLHLTDRFRPLPAGLEGVAHDGSVAGLWCYEAGQASFGDTLSWFIRSFPTDSTDEATFDRMSGAAATVQPGCSGLVALDWWNGNRVPWANSHLSGVLAGITLGTTAPEIYRALLESISYGARSVLDRFEDGGLPISRLILTSGLAAKNPLLCTVLADVVGRPVHVPEIDNPTAVGAAIHGAVAGQVVADFFEGRRRFGAKQDRLIEPNIRATAQYDRYFDVYSRLSANDALRDALLSLNDLASQWRPSL